MALVSNRDLIAKAIEVINPRRVGAYEMGQVGAALVTGQGNIYRGVCIDVGSGIGFCAEHSAIAAMVTAGETRIAKIVALYGDGDGYYFLSPCGRCREFIRQIDPGNLQGTRVILDWHQEAFLADLLPYADWYQPTGPVSASEDGPE